MKKKTLLFLMIIFVIYALYIFNINDRIQFYIFKNCNKQICVLTLNIFNSANRELKFNSGIFISKDITRFFYKPTTTPLIIACQNSREEIVEMLLKRNADPNLSSPNGITPLISTNNINIVRLLIKHGANINEILEQQNNALIFHSINHHYDIVELLLKHGMNPNIKDVYGNPLLHILIPYINNETHLNTLNLLIKNGLDINIKNSLDQTILYYLIDVSSALEKNNQLMILNFLLKKGCNIHDIAEHKSLLDFAIELENKFISFFLISHKVKIINQQTLFNAINIGDITIFKYVLENDSNNNYNRTFFGNTALCHATENNKYEIVDILLKYGFDFTIKNSNGKTALGIAKENGYADIVKLLKEAGAKD